MGDKELKIIAAAFVAFVLFAGGIMVFVLLDDKAPQVTAKQIPIQESVESPAVEAVKQDVSPPAKSRKFAMFSELCDAQEITQKQQDAGIELASMNGIAWKQSTLQEQLACCIFLAASLFSEEEDLLTVGAISGLLFSNLNTMRKEETETETSELVAIFLSLDNGAMVEKARQIANGIQKP